jgi:hypothetical protein
VFLSLDLFPTDLAGQLKLGLKSGQQSVMSRPNDPLPRHNQAFVELPVMSDIFGLAYLVGQIED